MSLFKDRLFKKFTKPKFYTKEVAPEIPELLEFKGPKISSKIELRIYNIHDCIISYLTSVVFILGIPGYLYILIVDYKEEPNNLFIHDPEDENLRSNTKIVWIWGMFVLLFCGFFLGSYCFY